MNDAVRQVLVNVVARSYVCPKSLRRWLLRRCGIQVGAGTPVLSRCTFAGLRVSIGENGYVSFQCVFQADAPIVIGDNVFLGPHVTFMTATHPIGERAKRAGPQHVAPITIGRGCWIGTNATVLAGVTVGDGCVIAAGAMVRADCEPDGLYAGVPARRVRDLP